MARELSQAELLDFLCRAGGRVANAALLAHFQRFLRDPAAGPEELGRRRELFKGFVNSVATVRQEAPGAAKAVVLRKRYRDLVGEEPRQQQQQQPPPPPPLDGPPSRAPQRGPGQAGGAPRAHGGPRGEEEPRPSRTCGASAPAELGALPPSPVPNRPPTRCALLGAEARRPKNGGSGPLGDPPGLPGGAPQASAPPSGGGLQQRIREWVARGAQEAALPPVEEAWPVFRSIRCQLPRHDLDAFLEQESPAASSEDSAGSSSSDSCRGGGEPGPPAGPSGCLPTPTGGARAREEVPPSAGKGGRPHLAPQGQAPRGSSSEDEPSGKDPQTPNGFSRQAKKVAHLPSPHLDVPLSPLPARWQGSPNSTPLAEASDAEGSPEHRSSLVPLEPREHTWLVKVAAGSWLQARALFLEDPHLVTRKDFVSGYTALHWLAKHGNAQVLLDFVAGARKAGVDLDVDVKSGCGYTPLHLAAMHGHQLVIRLLVQKLRCRTQVRDTCGKRPWQYLSSSTSGEIWQLLGAPKGKTIFPARPIARNASPTRKVSRKTSLAAYLKPQHVKWKMAHKYPALQEREEYSD